MNFFEDAGGFVWLGKSCCEAELCCNKVFTVSRRLFAFNLFKAYYIFLILICNEFVLFFWADVSCNWQKY